MLRLRVGLLILTVGCASWLAPIVTPGSLAAASEPAGRADFNGDGYADLAVTTDDVEAVHILYGSAGGLSASGNQLWSQGSPGIKGSPGGDLFGHSMAVGDFNGDGFGDLAVGAPAEKVGSVYGAGAVNVIYGSAKGLTATGDQLWSQSSPGVVGAAGEDAFGWSLAAANVGNSAHDDLVIGVLSEDVGKAADAGAVQVLYGSTAGLTASGNQLWTQNSPEVGSAAESEDGFGFTVSAGDFGRSDEADIAVGSGGEDVGRVEDAGSVHVLFGSSDGLTSAGSQLWTQDTRGVLGAAETGDGSGLSLAAGDFGRDGHADLAWGSPAESTRAGSDAGVVTVLYGSDAGLTATGGQSWSLDSSGIKGSADEDSWFGGRLATADLGAGQHSDLIVGAQYERIVGAALGAVHVIYGSAAGLTSTGDQLWSRDSAGVKGNRQEAQFGTSLAAGDFGRGASVDLAIGAPLATVAEEDSAGTVHVLYGSGRGLTAAGDQLWSRFTPGLLGGESFGFGRLLVSSP